MTRWNSRKLAALLVTLITNLLVFAKVDSETAQAFATTTMNALTLGYIIVQGWVDAKEAGNGNSH